MVAESVVHIRKENTNIHYGGQTKWWLFPLSLSQTKVVWRDYSHCLETIDTAHLSFYFYPSFFYFPYLLRNRQQTLKCYHRGESSLRLNNFKIERSR